MIQLPTAPDPVVMAVAQYLSSHPDLWMDKAAEIVAIVDGARSKMTAADLRTPELEKPVTAATIKSGEITAADLRA